MSGDGFLDCGARLRGRYEIAREIGRGGFSVVYEARDLELGCAVALKLMVPPPAVAEIARERMRREVQAARRLHHPHLVRIFDFLEEGPWTFVVMELVAGGDLQTAVRERGVLAADAVAALGWQLADALAAAHRAGVLHRDVKPQNVLIAEPGRYLLADFGSARIEGERTLTGLGAAVGTRDYLAAECLAGARGDARSDVYALGLTLHYALTGRLPDRGTSEAPLAAGPQGPRPLASEGTRVPVWLAEAIAVATSADARDRFPTAASFAQRLAAGDGGTEPSCSPRAAHAGGIDFCLVCGAPDPLGLAVCPRCAQGTPGRADHLVLVDPRGAAHPRGALHARLAELLAVPPSLAGLGETLRGQRALVRLAAAHAERARERLQQRGVPVRVLPLARAWQAVPPSFAALVAAVAASGALGGGTLLPAQGALGPLLAALLLVAALRRLCQPLLAAGHPRTALPERVQASVVRTLRALEPGAARTLFADLVQLGQASLTRLGGDPWLAAQLESLLVSAGEAACELASLDASLALLEAQRARFAHLPEGWQDAQASCEHARDCLVQRLLEVAATLASARGPEALRAGERLEGLVAELDAETRLQAEAAKEVESLLASFGSRSAGLAAAPGAALVAAEPAP